MNLQHLAMGWLLCLAASTCIGQQLLCSDGRRLEGTPKALTSKGWQLTISGGEKMTLTSDQLVRFGSQKIQNYRSGIVLTDGSIIAGRVTGASSSAIDIRNDWFDGPVPARLVRGIAFGAPVQYASRSRLMKSMYESDGNNDFVILPNGDFVTGIISFPTQSPRRRYGPIDIVLDDGAKSHTWKASAIRGVVLSPLLRPKVLTAEWTVGLDDGSRLRVDTPTDDRRVIALACGLVIPNDPPMVLDHIQSIESSRPAVSFVHELQQLAYKQQTPFSDLQWPIGIDQDLHGDPIAIDNHRYGRGIVMHANAQVAYALPSGTESFQGSLGVIGLGGQNPGSVALRVMTIGEDRQVTEKYSSPEVQAGSPLIDLSVDVSGAKVLVMQLQSAGDGTAGDHGAILDAFITSATN